MFPGNGEISFASRDCFQLADAGNGDYLYYSGWVWACDRNQLCIGYWLDMRVYGVVLFRVRPPSEVALNMLRFHQILRAAKPFHTFLWLAPFYVIPCD